MKRFISSRRRAATAALVLAAGAALTGCEGVGALARVVDGGNRVPPKFILPDRDTLVLVDDPENLLRNPRLPQQVGSTAVHYMRHQEVLLRSRFIDPQRLADYASHHEKRWSRLPIDRVGRELGAQQIIYARLESVSMHVAGEMYRPEARVEVKVLSADGGQRIWPNAGAVVDPRTPAPGHMIELEMDYMTRESSFMESAAPDQIARRLANEIGVAIAQLFYEWRTPEPGEDL